MTPTASSDILKPTMTTTTLPTVVYPTLVPTNTPTEIPSMVCSDEPVDIICKATVCVVRNEPRSGGDNIAYTIPNNTILKGAKKCQCQSCAPIEQSWFFLGRSGDVLFWAIEMNQVWEVNGE